MKKGNSYNRKWIFWNIRKSFDRFKDNDITNIIELGIGSIDEDGITMYHYKNLPKRVD